jgi:hypothetical protein
LWMIFRLYKINELSPEDVIQLYQFLNSNSDEPLIDPSIHFSDVLDLIGELDFFQDRQLTDEGIEYKTDLSMNEMLEVLDQVFPRELIAMLEISPYRVLIPVNAFEYFHDYATADFPIYYPRYGINERLERYLEKIFPGMLLQSTFDSKLQLSIVVDHPEDFIRQFDQFLTDLFPHSDPDDQYLILSEQPDYESSDIQMIIEISQPEVLYQTLWKEFNPNSERYSQVSKYTSLPSDLATTLKQYL